MGLILDVVPNHMSVGTANAWWADVLEHGPSSPYADYFDIAWFDSPRAEMHGRLLLPVLGDQYGAILESGELAPQFMDGRFVIRYHGRASCPSTREHMASSFSRQRSWHKRNWVWSIPLRLSWPVFACLRGYLPARLEADTKLIAEGRIECALIRCPYFELPQRFPRPRPR